jgi:hypothetical protein
MKAFVITLGVLCLGIATAVTYTNLKNAAPPAPAAETNLTQAPAPTDSARSSAPDSLRTNSSSATNAHRQAFLAASRPPGSRPSDPAADALRDKIATLVSPASTFQQREAIWKQLGTVEQLDEIINALKEGATNNPDSALYQAELGRANLQKAGIVSKNGGSMNELGILGMTADQNFDNALKIDPANWDAQFFKAVSMSYWPAELNKGNEVVDRLSNLINQQDSQPSQAEFAMPYIALGQQYQKLGQADNALQTWQSGAAKFPNDPTLQQKLAAAQAQH